MREPSLPTLWEAPPPPPRSPLPAQQTAPALEAPHCRASASRRHKITGDHTQQESHPTSLEKPKDKDKHREKKVKETYPSPHRQGEPSRPALNGERGIMSS